jgi:hypothetical protein
MSPTKTKRGTFDFTIVSKDYTLMESVFDTLDKRLKDKQMGSGYDLTSGERDHHFVCRAEKDAMQIAAAYANAFKGKRVGVSMYDND